MTEPVPFGKYTLLRKLAEGGMAEIYLALQVGPGGFGKLLVIKRIRPANNQDQNFIQMFLDEARIAASLSHPNIAQIFEVGNVETVHYIAMEHVHGEDLRSLCRKLAKDKKPLPLAHAISMLSGACAGLHYAHTKTDFNGQPLEIVHRDVSPQNLLISYDGHVKLVDFGIAKAQGRSQETRAGVLKGKISYMSPEQVKGDPLDARSDVFAAGILLYELTTGRRLYKDDSDFKVMRKITDEEPTPPSEIIPGYPPRLEQIVLKSLAKDPHRRYSSAQALQSDLEAFARQESLDISSLALGSFMREVFSDKLAEQAREEALGKPLHQILAERGVTEPSLIHEGSSSMARGELNASKVKRGRRTGAYVATVLSLLLAVAAGGYWLSPLLSPLLWPEAPAKEAVAASPQKHELSIESDPKGAEVYERGVLLGLTPLNYVIEGEEPLYLRFKRGGFYDEAVTVSAPFPPSVFVLFDEPVKAASSPSDSASNEPKDKTRPSIVGKKPPKDNSPKNTTSSTSNGSGSKGEKFIDPFGGGQ